MTDVRHADDGRLAFYEDFQPPAGNFRTDVLEGLSKPQKAISPKYFYDEAGSKIFDQITQAPEYYVTRTELALLDRIGPELAERAGPGAVVLEPGAGSSVKVRKLIDALQSPSAFVGMDISGEHVRSACGEIARDYPSLTVGAVCHDFTKPLNVSALPLPEGKRLVFFPGSTIGNFELSDARSLLETLRTWMRTDDAMIIGVDLRKDGDVLEAAYDDAGHATSDFNFNLVARMNAELNGDLDPEGLVYRAFWNPYRSRVEMYLQALRDQTFTLGGREFVIRQHETIHTENSHKFTVSVFNDLARSAGLSCKQVWISDDAPFSIHWLEVSREA